MPSVERCIVLTKGPPWGFRLYIDNNGILTISKIRRHSPAETAKLHAGDQLICLNGRNVRGLSHAQTVNIIDTTVGTLELTISRFETTSTKVLMFDKSNRQILPDARAGIDFEIKNHYVPFKQQVQQSVYEEMDTEDYFAPEPVHRPKTIIKRSPPVQPAPPEPAQPYYIPFQESKVEEVYTPEQHVEVEAPKPFIPVKKLNFDYSPDTEKENRNIMPSKRHFADSSFFHDPQNLYPTVEERMDLARQVATSLNSPLNLNSKGAAIFQRQKKRAEKHTIQQEDEEATSQFFTSQPTNGPQSYDLTSYPEMPALGASREPSPAPIYRMGYSSGPPPPPVAPPPPPPPNQTRTLPEFLEKVKKFPTSNHKAVDKNVCHDIATALHNSNSRGAQLFNRKKNKAHKWEVGAKDNNNDTCEPVMAGNAGPAVHTQPQRSFPTASTNSANNQFYKGKEPSPNVTNQPTQQNNPTVTPFMTNYSKTEPFGDSTSTNTSNSNNATSNTQTTAPTSNSNTKWKPVKFNIPPTQTT